MHTVPLRKHEIDKYRHLWRGVPEYRYVSPGLDYVGPCLAITRLQPGARVIDVGCGTGRARLKLSELLMDVLLVDGVADSRDEEAKQLPFLEACLWDDWPSQLDGPFNLAFCCDVLEHIPEAFAMLVVARCLSAAPYVFLHISHEPDQFGKEIGAALHVCVKDFQWWRDHLAEVGELLDARDLIGHGIYLLRRPSHG